MVPEVGLLVRQLKRIIVKKITADKEVLISIRISVKWRELSFLLK